MSAPPPEVVQRALLKWRNAYAAQRQAEVTHRAAVEQLDAAEYELAVVLGVAPAPPPPQYVPPPPGSPFAPGRAYPPNPPGWGVAPPPPPPVQPSAAPAAAPSDGLGWSVEVDDRPADQIVLDAMRANNVGGGGGGAR